MELFIGIEGMNARFSVAAVADEHGQILSAERLDAPLSLHTTPRPALRTRLMRLIRLVIGPLHLTLNDLSTATVCVGLSGVTFPYNAEVDVPRLFDEMEIAPRELICTRDTDIIFASHTQSDRGSAITCGQGSMAYVATPSGGFRVGGWGPALGDEGSGYWMGRAVMRAIGEEADLQKPTSGLWKEVQRFLGQPDESPPALKEHSIRWQQRCSLTLGEAIDPRTAIFSFAHDLSLVSVADWRLLASSLSIPLMRAWRMGDPTATQIVEGAAESLAIQFKQVCSVAHVQPDHGPLVMFGGVFTHHRDFRDFVLKRIHAVSGRSILAVVPGDPGALRPVCGALLLAIGRSHSNRLRLPDQSVIEHLRNQVNWHLEGPLAND